MLIVLFMIHLTLGVFAVGTGMVVLSNMISKHLSFRRIVFFLRCTLGSNIAALFLQEPLFQVHHLLPVQEVAMIAIYGTAVILFAWCKYRLFGAWGKIFAFGIATVLYLDTLALSLQLFSRMLLSNRFGLAVPRNVQASLFASFLLLGVLAARRFTYAPKALHL